MSNNLGVPQPRRNRRQRQWQQATAATLAATWDLSKTKTMGNKQAWACMVSLNPRFPNFNLYEEEVYFGRSADCEVHINSQMVSARHCRVWREHSEDARTPAVWLEDTSTNGTYVDGSKKLGRGNRVRLHSGTEVVIIPKGPNREKVSFTIYIVDEEGVEEAPEGQVTLVFTDVQSSTKLWEKHADSMDIGLRGHDFLFRKLLIKCRGYEVKTEGDAFFVAFFRTVDAIRWCVAAQKQLLELQWKDDLLTHPSACSEDDANGQTIWRGLRVRMGIHVGEPNCRRNPVHKRMDYFGPDVNTAARVSDSAHGGQIVCTAGVLRQLEIEQDGLEEPIDISELGFYRYKGIADPLAIYQIAPRELSNRAFPALRAEAVDVIG
ncbi:MAG: hypothetical protein MHM6MM_000659 [Cercozoa sp. M6MM]